MYYVKLVYWSLLNILDNIFSPFSDYLNILKYSDTRLNNVTFNNHKPPIAFRKGVIVQMYMYVKYNVLVYKGTVHIQHGRQ